MTISIEITLRRLIGELLNIEPERITAADSVESLGGDSLDTLELLMKIEDEFMIDLDDSAWEACATFDDFLKLVTETIGSIN